jgi:hypothetical protein
MKKIKLLSLGLALGAGLSLLPGCASTGHGGVYAGFGTNSVGVCVKTSTATNVYKLTLPFNPAALVQTALTSEGF